MEERFSSARGGAGWENGNTRSPWDQCDPTLWRIKLWGWIRTGTARRKPGGGGGHQETVEGFRERAGQVGPGL